VRKSVWTPGHPQDSEGLLSGPIRPLGEDAVDRRQRRAKIRSRRPRSPLWRLLPCAT